MFKKRKKTKVFSLQSLKEMAAGLTIIGVYHGLDRLFRDNRVCTDYYQTDQDQYTPVEVIRHGRFVKVPLERKISFGFDLIKLESKVDAGIGLSDYAQETIQKLVDSVVPDFVDHLHTTVDWPNVFAFTAQAIFEDDDHLTILYGYLPQ